MSGYYLLVFLLFVFIFFTTISIGKSFKYRRIVGSLTMLIIFACGFILFSLKHPPLTHSEENASSIIVIQTTEPVSEKANSNKATGKIISSTNSISEKIIIYFEKNERSNSIQYGDLIVLTADLQEVRPPQNPEEFNYKKYLQNKGIYRQAYIPSDQWELIGSGRGNKIIAFGYRLRHKLLKILEENNLSGKEYAVASAILLGFDDKLDKELISEFSGSGAMHILCVSGLHVGIIYFIFSSILFFLSQKKWQRYLKMVLLLLLIWIYAMITGFSPSVLRASTMFSFIIIGQSINRKTNIFNSLAASAFLLLLINPYFLFEVGFQLSYFAVVGIVSLHPLIYKKWIPKNLLIKKTWSLVVVSIVAQIATFPLSLYYFHQFPNYFILTNLIAIPASSIILYSGLLVLIFSPLPLLSQIFASVLSLTIQGLNAAVKLIENAPYSTLHHIQVSSFEMVLFYILSITLFLAISQKRKAIYLTSLSILVMLLGSFTFRKYEHLQQHKIAIYNIRNFTAMEFIDGKESVLFADSVLLFNPEKMDFHINNHRIANGVRKTFIYDIANEEIKNNFLCRKDHFLKYENLQIMILDDKFELIDTEVQTSIDFVVISEDSKIDIKNLCKAFNFREIIFTSSIRSWQLNKWVKDCEQLGINYHNVEEEGAWLFEF